MNTASSHANSHSIHEHHTTRVWQWPVLVGLGLLVVILGTIGFLQSGDEKTKAVGILDAIYDSLRLFHLHCEFSGRPLPWELQVARFLAPLVVGFAVVKAFLTVAHGHHRVLLHQSKSGHVVICGLGRKGLQLAKSFREQGKWVVVIEKDVNNELLQECENEGILYWIGDAGHLIQLKKARVHCAELLIAVTGDDGKNAEIAIRAAEMCRHRSSQINDPLRCIVHIVDPQLRNLFRERRIFNKTGDRIQATIFDFYESCALALFQEHAIDGGSGISPGSNTSVRLVIVSFGQMGESVLLQAARIGHFADGRKVRATVIDPDATRLKQNFNFRYPNFDQASETEFLNTEFETPEVAALIKQLCSESDSVLTFAVCCDDDSRSMRAALYLKSQLKDRKATILARLSTANGLTTLLSNDQTNESPNKYVAASPLVDGIEPFGLLERLCVPGTVLNQELDHQAMKIHQDFVGRETKRLSNAGLPPRDDAGVQPWPSLEDEFKNSNRQQALHLQIKLRAICCRSADTGKQQSGEEVVASFTDVKEIELLAQMEHARWCAERWLAGWEPAPTTDRPNRKSADLVLWDRLSDESKTKDIDSVKLIPQIITVLRRATSDLKSSSHS